MAGPSDAPAWLFVPGDRPQRFEKAAASGADEVICDLEDAVPAERKDQAREAVRQWLAHGGRAWVRVNAWGTEWYEQDIDRLAALPGLRGLMVPKAEAAPELEQLGRRLLQNARESSLVALVETALGVQRVQELASCRFVARLAFGSIDFAAEIDAEETDESLLLARSSLVLASRAVGRPAPLDGVSLALDDAGAVSAAARRARALGFGGKLCIHPSQVAPVQAAFRPTPDEVAWAERVLAAAREAGGAVTVSEGRMIDKPLTDKAMRILSRAKKG